MNRKQRRLATKHKKNQSYKWPSNWNLLGRIGLRYFRKLTGQKLDINALVKSQFNKKSLAEHNWGIYSDPEFRDKDAITSEVTSMLLSMPGDHFYPKIRPDNKEWPAMLGIKPNKSRVGYVGELLLYYHYLAKIVLRLTKIVIESIRIARAGLKGTLKGTPIHNMVNYHFSRSIASRHSHDKGRHRNPERHGDDDILQAKFVSREVKPREDDAITKADIDRVEMLDLCNRFGPIYEHAERADQLVMYNNILEGLQGLSWKAGYHRLESEYRKVGITTYRGAKKRKDSLLRRIPELKQIKDALEK